MTILNIDPEAVGRFVAESFARGRTEESPAALPDTLPRREKAFALLPAAILEAFLSGAPGLTIGIARDSALPLGMQTTRIGEVGAGKFRILLYGEHQGLPEDQFIGAFLHQIGVVVALFEGALTEPAAGPQRSRFKEMLECEADVLVWQWGLAFYSLSHLNATYPAHVTDRIVADIKKRINEMADHPEILVN